MEIDQIFMEKVEAKAWTKQLTFIELQRPSPQRTLEII